MGLGEGSGVGGRVRPFIRSVTRESMALAVLLKTVAM